MEDMRKVQIPAFGNWDDYYDFDVPVTQYFDSTIQSDVYNAGYYSSYGHNQEVDLFKVPVTPLYTYHQNQNLRMERRCGTGEEKQNKTKDDHIMKRQGRVHDLTIQKQINQITVRKAVDEDLYKIPPELLYKKQQKKGRTLKKLLSGCLSFGCVA